MWMASLSIYTAYQTRCESQCTLSPPAKHTETRDLWVLDDNYHNLMNYINHLQWREIQVLWDEHINNF